MAWCLGCSYEYVEGMSSCPDCGMPLKKAPGLSELVIYRKREWVPIRSVREKIQADLIKGLLDSNGIDSVVQGNKGRIESVFGIGGGPGSEVNVLVPVDHAKNASILLRTELDWTAEELTEYMEEHDDLDDEYEYSSEDDILNGNGVHARFDDEEYAF